MSTKRTALVTGASAGIGRELARLFAADRHDVVIVARRAERLEELAAELAEKYGVSVYVETADLTDPSAPEALFDSLRQQDVHVDFLVNNAGVGSNGTFWELDRQWELDQIELNVKALVALMHLFIPGMVERKFGRILNIASTAAFQPGPYMSTYYATKAFVMSFSCGVNHELAGTGVTVTTHCPGPTATEFGAISGNGDSTLFQKGSVATSEEVARHGYDAMHAGKEVVVHGAANSFGAFMTRFTPRGVLSQIAAKLNQ